MVVLHTMARIGWGMVSPSPFCAKVEVYLKMLGEPYEARPTLSAAAGPRKKLPWIEEGALRFADSEVILDHLRVSRGDPLGEDRVPAERRALGHLARRTVEESLYFVMVAERWGDERVYQAYTRELFSSVPAPVLPLVAGIARRMVHKLLWQQGTGRHPLDEALGRGVRDIEAVAWALGDSEYFGGATPSGIDAAMWGAIANVWYVPVDSTLKSAVASHPNLTAWLERMVERYALNDT